LEGRRLGFTGGEEEEEEADGNGGRGEWRGMGKAKRERRWGLVAASRRVVFGEKIITINFGKA
jgi:hypothetical protein